MEIVKKGIESSKQRFEKALMEGKIDEQKKIIGIFKAEIAYSEIRDECYKKF